jgi:hypothetical protein
MSSSAVRSDLAVVLVVVLTVGAGCAAVPNGPEASGGTDLESGAGPPPGLSTDGVTNASALVDAHTDTLTERSFTVRSRTTTRPVDGNYTVTTTRTWRVEPGQPLRGVVRLDSRTTGEPPTRVTRRPDRLEAYRDGRTTYQRVRNGSDVTYRRVGLLNTSLRLNPALHRRAIAQLENRANVSVQPVTHNGTEHYRVTARLDATRLSENVSLRLLVAPSGVVRTLRLSRTVEYRSGPRRLTRTARVTDVGRTTVTRPAWYDDAVNATRGDVSATID